MLDISKIDTIIWDLDQTIYAYWGKIAESFAHYTALSARKHITERPRPHPDYLTDQAQKSYEDHGLTTRVFRDKYGFDEPAEIELYKDHHNQLFQDVMVPQWKSHCHVHEELPQIFNDLADCGIRNFILTHGTTKWAEGVLSLAKIQNYIEQAHGIDEFNLRLKNKDASLWVDFMNVTGIQPIAPNDYSNVLVVEDSPVNLLFPKREFNMQTALVQTDRICSTSPENIKNIDGLFTRAFAMGQFIVNAKQMQLAL